MLDVLQNSVYFGVVLSLVAYGLGVLIKKRFGLAIFNPLLLAIVFVIIALKLLHIDYADYAAQTTMFSYLLTPSTVCLAIPLFEQFELLKKNKKAVAGGLVAGVLTSMTCVFVLSLLFGLSHVEYVTLLPKSITTAIGMGVSEMLGGYVTITIAVIIITGIIGNISAEAICRVFRIDDPVARGIAIGSASHAMGTAKAMEMGEIEGAMSSLSIAVAGLLTVVCAPIFAGLIR